LKGGVEVEAKIMLDSCTELGRVRERLRGLGAALEGEVFEEDIYYQHPCRDFAETDEALRLRRAGGTVELTYKGPKRLVGGSKAREEVTVRVDPGEAERLDRLLDRLGFRRAARVAKRREYYRLGSVSVSLDEVEGLGCFVEIEYRGGGGVEEASRSIEEAAERLGLRGKPRVYKSYLELLLERSRSTMRG